MENAVEVVVIKDGTHEHEAIVIAQKILGLRKQGVSLCDIAILARTGTHFDTLIDVLNRAGIKCVTDKKVSATDTYEIALLNNALWSAFDPTYELPAVLLQQSFMFNIKEFRAFQDKYHELCKQMAVVDVLTTFIAEYDIVNKLLSTPEGERRVQNIYNFLNKLRGASFASTVAQYLYLLERDLLDIKIENSSGGGECVRIMTIHSAKGLEFGNVFLYDAGGNFSSADRRKNLVVDKTCGLCVYSTDPEEFTKHVSIARLGAVILADRVQIAEEMRLLYVALTRAKDRLIIVGSTTRHCVSEAVRQSEHRSAAIPPLPHDFEILSSKNYLDFIRPTDTISADDIEIIENKKKQPQHALISNPKEKLAKKPYPYKAATNMEQKTSVTALTKHEGKITVDKYTGAEAGTQFHREMQHGELLEPIKELTYGMTIHKELMFLQNVEQNGEQILVQGVIDLLAVSNDRAILIDYKTTHASAEKLIEYYKPQLDMYAEAVKQALNLPVEKFIYSTTHSKLVPIT